MVLCGLQTYSGLLPFSTEIENKAIKCCVRFGEPIENSRAKKFVCNSQGDQGDASIKSFSISRNDNLMNTQSEVKN